MPKLCLIIEDSATQAMAIMRMVSSLGWNMLTATTMTVAREALGSEAIDLVLADLVLPDSSDGNTIARLREVKPNAMIAAMSAGGGGGDARELLARARAQGASFMLPKPFTVERLKETFDEAVRRIETGTRTEHVLVVDDSSTVRMICARALQAAGIRVSQASTIDSAIDDLDILDLDALVSDIHMPGSDVIELLPDLREALPGVGLVLMTGGRDDTDQALRRALAAGAHAALPKPFQPADLIGAIRRARILANSDLIARRAG